MPHDPKRTPTARVALLICLLAACPALDAVPAIPRAPGWDRFVMLVYQTGTDAARDQALYESVNLRGFHSDRQDERLLALAQRTGWPFYVDHAADKGFLHLGEAHAAAVTRRRELIVRPNSLADPATIERLHGFLAARIGAAKGSSAIAYAFDDEISLGSFCSPAEVDGHPRAVAFFRGQLAASYGTIERLNQQYGTSFADVAAVEPTTFEQVRGQLTRDGIAGMNLSSWCDWRSAMDTHFAEVLAGLTRFANGIDATVPAGFVGGQAANAWGGYDWRKLSTAVQWTETYDIGGANAILRSFWTQQRPRMQTFFSSRDPRLDAWFLWYYLCQGNRGVIIWPEGWFSDGTVADHVAALADTFKEVQGPVSRSIIDGTFLHDPVALYYSQPSIQVSWALDAACHGKTWPNRLSSMDNAISTSGLSRVAWLKTLQDLGVQPRVIHQDHLLAGELTSGGYKVLVLNRALCLSDAEVTAIGAFAKGGGMVIADHLCGICDERGKARTVGALDRLFGVARDLGAGWLDGQALSEVNGELGNELSSVTWAQGAARHLGLAVFERGLTTTDQFAGIPPVGPAVEIRRGRAVYLNLSPIGYLLHRRDGLGSDWLALVADLLADAGVAPRVRLSSDGPTPQLREALFWKNAGRTTLCVVENLDRAATISSFGATTGLGAQPVTLQLRFAAPVKDLRNERTGVRMGDGVAFSDAFVPWEANVYTYAD